VLVGRPGVNPDDEHVRAVVVEQIQAIPEMARSAVPAALT
jgi:hypothetical protein